MSETGMTYETLTYDVDVDGVATITLDRPEAMNAFTVRMHEELIDVFGRLSADDSAKVGIVTGAGRAFCAGADMEALQGIDPNEVRRGESIPFDMNRRASATIGPGMVAENNCV